jgi:hypothetical protein
MLSCASFSKCMLQLYKQKRRIVRVVGAWVASGEWWLSSAVWVLSQQQRRWRCWWGWE